MRKCTRSGEPAIKGSFARLMGGLNNSYFGDLDFDFTGGQAQWDYVRWTNAGQFELPEPTSVLMVILTGLLLCRRRRREI